MITKLNIDTSPDAGTGNRNAPVFKNQGATSFSRFTGTYRGQVMKTDEKEIYKKGRLKVYVFGVYPDASITSPDDLPWSYPETPSTVGGKYQQGWTSIPEVGAWVSVRFDCGNINKPVYIGTVPGRQNKIKGGDARNSQPMHGKADNAGTFDKPDSHEYDLHRYADKSTARIDYGTKMEKEFKPLDNVPAQAGNEGDWDISWKKLHEHIKYPYNHIFSTGKHTMEFDNTDGYERISIGHRNGSHFSMDWAGDQIAEARGTMWNTAKKNIVDSAEKNVASIAKQHRTTITQGDDVIVVGGRTEMYFGKTTLPADLMMDFDTDNLVSQVKVSASDASDKDTYWEFAGDHELKHAKAFIQEVEGDYSREVKGKTKLVHQNDMLMQVNGGELTMKCTNVMNLEGSLIKLNCGGGQTARKTPMKGGKAGTGAGSPGASSKGRKQPSDTVNDDSTARSQMLLAQTTPMMDSPTVSKYDAKLNRDCSKI